MFEDPRSTFLILVVMFIVQFVVVVFVHDMGGSDDDL